MADLEVTPEQMATGWATPSRIAQDFMVVLSDTLACSPWGAPLMCGDCGDPTEMLLHNSPSPNLEVLCCGGIIVAVRRMFWHDGRLNEIRQLDPNNRNWHWGFELSAAVLRCTPELGGWGGLPITASNEPRGALDDDILTDQATILASDQLALMLAQEVTFETSEGPAADTFAATQDCGIPIWLPAPVERLSVAHNCKANVIGWNRGAPIKVNLHRDMVPCASDCIAHGDRLGI